MIRLIVRHQVRDYGAWKKAYDAFDPKRQTLGVKDHAVFRGAVDRNDVTVWHDFATLDEARRFTTSPELVAAMEKAGVVGTPTMWLVDRELPS